MANAEKPNRHWWEHLLVGSPKSGYVLGSIALVIGVGALVTAVATSEGWWSKIFGIYFALWGSLMLLGARAKSRAARTAGASSQQ